MTELVPETTTTTVRTIEEVTNEYTVVCAQLGDKQIKSNNFNTVLQKEFGVLLSKVEALSAEADAIRAAMVTPVVDGQS